MTTAVSLREVRNDLESMGSEFTKALPPQMTSERFIRNVLTAVQLQPELLEADRKSLFAACMKAAQDGLLPDGREGALVLFRSRNRQTGQWVKAVQWLPMVAGLLKKARNSGEISSISAHIVYKNDRLRLVLGDEEAIEHEPHLDGDRGEPRLVYAICKLRDGGIVRDWMSVAEINRVRSASRSGESGPWQQWPEEMWKKTVIRRLCKRLPASTDREKVDGFMQVAERVDEDFDHAPPRDVTPPSRRDPLDAFAELADAPGEAQEHEAEESVEAPAP